MREYEDLMKCVQLKSILRLELTTDSRVVTRQKCHMCEACRKLKGHGTVGSLQDKKVQSDLFVS